MKTLLKNQTVGLNCVALLLLFAFSPVHSATMYKWVDSEGRVSYQDRPPPKNAKVLSEKALKDKKANKQAEPQRLNKKPIDVYVTQNCASCNEVTEYLDSIKVPYNAKNIEEHREIQQRIIQENNSISVPALFIEGEFVKAPSRSALNEALEKSGYIIDVERTPTTGVNTEE